MPSRHRKVAVIGAGSVGTTYIYALLQTGLAPAEKEALSQSARAVAQTLATVKP